MTARLAGGMCAADDGRARTSAVRSVGAMVMGGAVGRTEEFDGRAGRVSYRIWEAPSPTHLVVLVHGYGEHIGRYEHVAGVLVARGAVVYGPDHVGHGRSAGERVVVADFEAVVDDVHTVAVGAAYAADELVWHGPFRRPTLAGWQRVLTTIGSGPPLGDLPVLWVHGEDDRLVPLSGTRPGIEQLGARNLVERIYPGARHEVFNETNADEVLSEVAAFVDRVVR